MIYYLYILKCIKNKLYIGITNNLEKRFLYHKNKLGTKFTTKYLPLDIVYTEKYNNYQEARKREIQIKKWSRIKKDNLIRFGRP